MLSTQDRLSSYEARIQYAERQGQYQKSDNLSRDFIRLKRSAGIKVETMTFEAFFENNERTPEDEIRAQERQSAEAMSETPCDIYRARECQGAANWIRHHIGQKSVALPTLEGGTCRHQKTA